MSSTKKKSIMNSFLNKQFTSNMNFSLKFANSLKKCLYHNADDCFKSYNARNSCKSASFCASCASFCEYVSYSSENEQKVDSSIEQLTKALTASNCRVSRSNATIRVIKNLKIRAARVAA